MNWDEESGADGVLEEEEAASVASACSWLLRVEERFAEHDIPKSTGPPETDDDLPDWVGQVARQSK